MLQFLIALIAAALLGAPVLMAQNDSDDDWDDDWDEAAAGMDIHGFVEGAVGARIVDDFTQPNEILMSEARFRLDLTHFSDDAEFAFKGDIVSDGVTDNVDIDIRQALVTLQAFDWLDIRAGRQTLTWGTGDLVFLNDLFPKDFVSFFIGRDDEFLKAPSTALKLTLSTSALNADFVWTPIFEPDRFITGERLSFFSPLAGRRVGINTLGQPLQAAAPLKNLNNGEFALRVYQTIGGYEAALYGYAGFTKQPLAFGALDQMPRFARLGVYGASLRGSLFGGITNIEGAWYHAPDDPDGDEPALPNSQVRALVGHERELFAKLHIGLQYYLEWTLNHDELLANSPNPAIEPYEFRHVVTTRLTYRLMRETLSFSLFAFVTVDRYDIHIRPTITRNWSDALSISVGANVMVGEQSAFFGQLENNKNAYIRLRYGF